MQTSITKNPVNAFKGLPANFDRIVTESLTNEDTTAIEPGWPLVRGTDPATQVLLPIATFTSAEFAGISAFGNSKEVPLAGATTGTEYATGDQVTVMVEGVLNVLVEDTVVKGTQVFAVFNTGASTIWTYRSDLDTANAVAIPAIFQESGTTGQIVPIRIDWSV